MSNVTKVSYSKSYEMIWREGTVWEKIGLEAELSEGDIPEVELQGLKDIVERFHLEHLPDAGEDTFTTVPVKKQPVKLVPDAMTIASYQKFKKNGNTAMVQNLESIYNFPNA